MDENFSKRREKNEDNEVDEELYQYIAAQTQSIGESASDILRRLLNLPTHATSSVDFFESVVSAETPKSAVHSEPVLTEKATEASQPKLNLSNRQSSEKTIG